MLSGEMARSQIADRVREAEAGRLARSSLGGSGGSTMRRATNAVLAVLLWPFRH